MADVFTPEKRSAVMSKIKGKNTKPEIMVGKYLYGMGFRYRKNVKMLPGKPDFVLGKYKSIIFVNGCFWHGHKDCKYFVVPKTRTEWWLNKINRTKENDNKSTALLENAGWNVITIWECSLENDYESTMSKLVERLKSYG